MFEKALLFEERTGGQIGWTLDSLRSKSGPGKRFLIKWTVIGRVMQHNAELLELIGLDLLRIPFFSGHGQVFESLVATAIAPGGGQQTIAPSHGPPHPERQRLVEVEEGIKIVLQAHRI